MSSPDPAIRALGVRQARAGLEAKWGPYLRTPEMMAALAAEIDGGMLTRSPEARIELARALAKQGNTEAATARLAEAARVVADIASADDAPSRERARVVNDEASRVFYEMGKPDLGAARYAVSRYYSIPANRRHKGDRIPYVQGERLEHETGAVDARAVSEDSRFPSISRWERPRRILPFPPRWRVSSCRRWRRSKR